MTKKQLFFHEENDIERKALDILKKCSRNSSLLVAIALTELSEKYNLSSVSSDKMKKFIEFYSFIENSDFKFSDDEKGNAKPIPLTETPIKKPPIPSVSDSGLISRAEKDEMKDIMANTFFA